MSWNEAKKLSDVVVSNVVPSETLIKSVSGANKELTVNGCGIANILSADTGGSGRIQIKIDDNEQIAIPYSSYQALSLTFEFKEKFYIKNGGNSNSNSTVALSLYDRQSIFGGRVVSFLPFRKAVAA